MNYHRVFSAITSFAIAFTASAVAQEVIVHPRPAPERAPSQSLTPDQIANMPVKGLPIRDFKLLNSTTGWASTGNRLLLTTDDGAHWKDISPATPSLSDPREEKLGGVFFLDANTGWVLYATDPSVSDRNSSPGGRPDSYEMHLALTTDGGDTWTTVARIPTPQPWQELSGSGSVVFADKLHGWVDLGALRAGVLYVTSDGGKSWRQTHGPGVEADMIAPSRENLWLLGGDDYELFLSRDGGSTVQKVSIPAPASVPRDAHSTYSLPVFKDSLHGFEAVTYVSSESSMTALFATEDGGRAWKEDRSLAGLPAGSIQNGFPSAITDSEWVLSFTPLGKMPTLEKLRPGDQLNSSCQGTTSDFRRCALSFADSEVGWAQCSDSLLLTTDGGSSWTAVTPRVHGDELTTDPIAPLARTDLRLRDLWTPFRISPRKSASRLESCVGALRWLPSQTAFFHYRSLVNPA